MHDGPGIRTTVFLKGCCLKCPWCSNPENISYELEEYSLEDKTGTYGKDYSIDELFKILLKDKKFWGKEGGVTFSGGEPFLQSKGLLSMLQRTREEGVHTVIESSLFSRIDNFEELIELIDFFIVDIKILDPKNCYNVLNGDVDVYYKNVESVYNANKLKLFRIPLNYEYTFTAGNREIIKKLLYKYPDVNVQVFAVHNLGERKYQSLGRELWSGREMDEQDMSSFTEELRNEGIKATIIRI